jgi:hypothetical protein
MNTCKRIVSSAVIGLAALSSAPAWASSISAIEAAGSGTQTVDSGTVTAILSQPGMFNGKTYTSWSFLVDDGTGSMDMYGTLAGLGYTPTVGDTITATGAYAPYHQIPELAPTSIAITSTTNSYVPGSEPTVGTISASSLNPAIGTALPFSVAGHYITVSNVTIGGLSGTFGIANLTGTITDGSGNSMSLYYWPTSYSVANANLFGQTIPTGPVNITGFDSVYSTSSAPEFTPISITAAPEPASLALLALGGLLILPRRKHA